MEENIRELEKIAFERGLAEDRSALARKPISKSSIGDDVKYQNDCAPDGLARTPRILIIDDDTDFRGMLRQLLQKGGYEVIEAADGNEGLQRQFNSPCDLIISDVIMPEKEGIDTVMEIRKKFPEAKIIMISGGGWYGTDIDFDMARKLGAVTLKKPFTIEKITAVIQELLNSD